MKPPPARGDQSFVGWVSQLPVVGVCIERKVSQMNHNELAAIVVGCLSLVSIVVGPTYLVVHNSTLRTVACVKSGGQYLQVPNTTTMECRR